MASRPRRPPPRSPRCPSRRGERETPPSPATRPRGRAGPRAPPPPAPPGGGPPHAREERMGKRSLAYPAGPVHDERGRGTAEPLVQGADLRVPPEQLPPGDGGGRRPPGGPGPLVAAPPA